MREHPAVKIWRYLALIPDIATRSVIARGFNRGRFDNLVIREHILCFFGTRDCLASHAGLGTIGANDGACTDAFETTFSGHPSIANSIMNPADAIGIALEFIENADASNRSGIGRPDPQPLIKMFAVDHADKAAFNGHVDINCVRRNHPCRVGACDQQVIGNPVILDEPRWYCAATRFDPSRPVE